MSQFGINTKVFWGEDRYSMLSKFIEPMNLKKVLLIVDGAIAENAKTKQISDYFLSLNMQIIGTYVPKIIGEPSYDDLDIATSEVAKNKPELIVGIGGGSVMDLAKGICVLLNNPGKGIDYRGMNKVNNPSVPFIAVPTTAGTGSEVTWTAAFTDNQEGKKLGINGKNVTPLCGLLEPAYIETCPLNVAISSGLDAMVHAIEAVTAKTATEMTEILGTKAFAMMHEALPKFVEGDRKESTTNKLLLSAYVAGIAMMNAGGGPASGISYPLGVHYKVPHGFAGGIFLPHVFDANVAKGYKGYDQVYKALENAKLDDPKSYSQKFVENFKEFYVKVKGPVDLSKWGCSGEEAINKLTKLTVEQRMENLLLNPVPFDEKDTRALLSKVCL